MSRLRVLLAAAVATTLLAACGDGTGSNGEIVVQEDTLALFPINGTPHPANPVGISVITASTSALTSDFLFDVAFDLDAQNRVVVYPVRLVAGNIVQNTVGISQAAVQRVPGNWSSVTRAPSSGYRSDSALVLAIGEVVAIQVPTQACIYALRGVNVYGKFVVDSVLPASRQIFGRMVANQNCGYRSLVPGIPKD